MKSHATKEKTLKRMNQTPAGHKHLKQIADGKGTDSVQQQTEAKAALNGNRVKPSRLKKSHISPSKAEGKPRKKVARYS